MKLFSLFIYGRSYKSYFIIIGNLVSLLHLLLLLLHHRYGLCFLLKHGYSCVSLRIWPMSPFHRRYRSLFVIEQFSFDPKGLSLLQWFKFNLIDQGIWLWIWWKDYQIYMEFYGMAYQDLHMSSKNLVELYLPDYFKFLYFFHRDESG